MSNYRRSGGTCTDASQEASGAAFSTTANPELISASATNTVQSSVGLRFTSNTLGHAENIISARLTMRFTTATTGAKFDIFGHKVLSSADWGSAPNDVNTRFAALTTANVQVRSSVALPTTAQVSFDVTAIVQELVNQTSWTTGVAITFILKSYNDASYTTQIASFDGTDSSQYPELYVSYGTAVTNDCDIVSAGDSHGVCAVNAGAVATNVSVVAPGWSNQVIAKTYIGAVSTASGTNIFGVGADQRRGYTPNGIFQDSLEAKYTGTNAIKWLRSEYAVGGTTMAQWATDAANTGGVGYWDGATPTYGPSLNYRIAHPLSASKRMLLWWSNIGNDIFQFVSGTDFADASIIPRGAGWGSTDWSDSTDMSKMRNKWVADAEACFTHAFSVAATAGTDLRIIVPGYHNFQVYGNNPTDYHYVPDVSGQPLERMVWGTSGYGFFAQVNYDAITSQVRAGAITDQSTYVQAAAWYMIANYGGSWNPNNTFFWNLALANVATTPLNSPRTWYHYLNTTFTDLWRHTLRNITDINVNQYMIGETHAVYARVVALHPEWIGKLFFLPHPQACGVDTTNPATGPGGSADHTSVYAQPPWEQQFEGIHMSDDYFRTWVDAVVTDMDTKVDFLPGYVPPGATVATRIDRVDPTTHAVITPDVTSLISGWSYEANLTVTATTVALNSFSVNVAALTANLDGSARILGTKVPSGTVVLSDRAIDPGNTFSSLGNIAVGETWNFRVRGGCS